MDSNNKIGEKWQGYFITAYGIAVKHGFKGSEEEWLASLIGPKGEPFRFEDFTPEQLEGLIASIGEGAVSEAKNAAQASKDSAAEARVAADNANDIKKDCESLENSVISHFSDVREMRDETEHLAQNVQDAEKNCERHNSESYQQMERAILAETDAKTAASAAAAAANQSTQNASMVKNALSEIDSKILAAAEAAERALSAESGANSAVIAAKDHADRAENAKEAAEEAKNKTDAAIEKVESAKRDAVMAEQGAKSYRDNAEVKASEAKSSADVARESMAKAVESEKSAAVNARLAETAASLADEAKGQANIAAANAKESEEIVSQAAGGAEEAKNAAVLAAQNASIASDEAKTSATEAKATLANTVNRGDASNALHGTKTGSVVSADDVSPLVHPLSVKVSSKNLIPYPYPANAGQSLFTDNGDGTLTLNGTTTDAVTFSLTRAYEVITDDLEDGANYIFKVCDGIDGVTAFLSYRTPEKSSVLLPNRGTLKWSKEYSVNQLWVTAAAGNTFENVILKPMLEKGITATAYTPYVPSVEGVTVSRCGKNLFMPELEIGGIAGSGANYNNTAQIRSSVYNPIVPASYYIFTTLPDYFKISAVFFYDKDKTYISASFNFTSRAIDLSAYDVRYVRFRIAKQDGTDMTEEDIELAKTAFQIEIGDTATEYEPYVEPVTSAADADGNVTGLISASPSMTLTSDTENVIIECEYNRDLMKVIEELTQAIISLGGNI